MAVAAERTGSVERQPRFRDSKHHASCERVRMFQSQRSRPCEARKEADPNKFQPCHGWAYGSRDRAISQTLIGVYYERRH